MSTPADHRGAKRWSLLGRYRTTAFTVVFVATMVTFMPLVGRLLVWGLDDGALLAFFGVAAVPAFSLVLAAALARAAAAPMASPLNELRNDVRRSIVAELHGRRGSAFLASEPDEPVEVAQLRDQVRQLHDLLHSRIDDEQSWVASAVHDVKAGVVGLAHILDAESERQRENQRMRVARDEAWRLVEVLSRLTDLVRFSRLESVEQREVDVGTLLARVVAARHEAPSVARGVHLTLELAGADRAVVVEGDASLLERAFSNLIDNAIRVARSVVRVSVYPNLVRIEDDGPGLRQELATLTQPFRSETVTISGVPVTAGTLGLGLFIARRVLEAHGGRLSVERTSSEGTVLLAYLGTS
jgi:signal transduction histidine kinase